MTNPLDTAREALARKCDGCEPGVDCDPCPSCVTAVTELPKLARVVTGLGWLPSWLRNFHERVCKIPKGALGYDSRLGHSYRDELLFDIANAIERLDDLLAGTDDD